jgi:acetyl esterase/lipase
MSSPSSPARPANERTPHRVVAPVWGLIAIALLAACGDDGGTEPNGRVVAGVDLDVLFAPATTSEIDAVLADWAGRSPTAAGFQVESVDTSAAAGVDLEIRVVSHTVDGNRHYGAVVVPFGPNADPGPLPILAYLHGGDDGFSVTDITLIAGQAPALAGSVVWVAPSFRSEELRHAGGTLTSEGDASPWDRDVDDALALLAVAAAEVPEADPSRVALLGLSRGAGVALLMAERDPSIDMVVEFFGPTDFFGAFVQDVVADALRGTVRNLPGLEVLNAEFIVPLRDGETTIQAVRGELVRRSAVLFADRLPDLQVHHGELDPVVDVSQAESLIDTMLGLGRGATPLCPPTDGPSGTDDPLFEACLYPAGSHNPLTMAGSIPRTETFLERIFAP